VQKEQFNQLYLEDLSTGMEEWVEHTFSQSDVDLFASLSGDISPVHINKDFAGSSIYKRNVVHGILVSALFSNLIGTKLPGAYAIYESQTLQFRKPVYPGDNIKAVCQIESINYYQMRVIITCRAWNGSSIVVDGQARVLVPSNNGNRY